MSEQSLTAHIYCRQKMADILIHDLHNLASEALKTMTNSRSYQILAERIIDCTGDADIAHLAGAEYRVTDKKESTLKVKFFLKVFTHA